jgi:tetratricopeptide (TPR) repeat protein
MRFQNQIAYYRDRCKTPLSQRQLARVMNVHINTVKNWEAAGCASPADLLRLVEIFLQRGALPNRSAAERFWECSGKANTTPAPLPLEFDALFTTQPLDLPPTIEGTGTLPSAHRLRLAANPCFVGRVEILTQLASALSPALATAAVTGIGGMGKTQLALEFAHRYGRFFYGGVFWISMGDPHAIPAEIADCGGTGRMELRADYEKLPQNEQVALVQAAWSAPAPRLLVFDNCEDEQLLALWRPVSGGCRVLITSRRTHWDPTLGVQFIPLGGLQRDESLQLLSRLSGWDKGHRDSLEAIAEELGDLPLALHLAGGFLGRYRAMITPTDYVADLRRLLLFHPSIHEPAHMPVSPTGYRHGVDAAIALSYARLNQPGLETEIAFALLLRMSFFAPGDLVARDLLYDTLDSGKATSAERRVFEDALIRLINLGLIETGANGVLRMHRLIAAFVQLQVTSDDIGGAARTAVEQSAGRAARRADDFRDYSLMHALQPHLRLLADRSVSRADALSIDLCYLCGWHQTMIGVADLAQHYCSLMRDLSLQLYGEYHTMTAGSYNLLGLMHQMISISYDEADCCFAKAAMIWEHLFGVESDEIALVYGNWGYFLVLRGDYLKAIALLRKSACIRRRINGLYHPNTGRSIHGIGYALQRSGRLGSAMRYLRLALSIREQTLPAQHLATALTLNTLGEISLELGQFEKAKTFHERSYQMRLEICGERHWATAESVRNLGRMLSVQGAIEAGLEYLYRSVDIMVGCRGVTALDTAWCYDQLAEALLSQGVAVEAYSYFEKALIVYRTLLLPDHPDTQRVERRLAQIDSVVDDE